ncbi:MAG TPA: argininosuccinate lyase [Thermomicrobiales bacterium]|nr:argininosuccinate lyase [Thermomicrobiales bacterium]
MTGSEGVRQGTVKAWGGRFAVPPDARLEAFNASVNFDIRLVHEDIRGSIAHVRMLGKQGIVSMDEANAIEDGLWRVYEMVDDGTFQLTLADEDVHTGVERQLGELIGPLAGKLHTGRSRNDQVATDLRLWTKGGILALTGGVLDLAEAMLGVARAHPDVVMPGYTHLQRAQPVLLAHHMLAYVAMLLRDADRLQDAYRRADVLPLGSGALAGVTYPINRQMVAEDLGFAAVSMNSLDAVSDRDFVLDSLYACALMMMHVSRLCEEVILWSSAEFRFVTLDDAFSTGSSIMPQKKNADVAELARGKTGRVFGHLMALLTTTKGLPLTYNKDLQEDKEGLFDAIDTTLAVLDVVPPMLATATFNTDRLAEAAVADFSLATDAADLLAKEGVPFREAHGVVGRLVARCIEAGITFAELGDEDWEAAHPVFARQRPPLDAVSSVASRDVPGGTASGRVREALEAAGKQIAALRDWRERLSADMERVMRSPARPGAAS